MPKKSHKKEVLIKVITKLSTFKGESKFRTWLYRIAANHVLNMKRRSAESKATTFADHGAAIQRTPDLDLPDPKSVPVSLPILVEETKNSCTMGMFALSRFARSGCSSRSAQSAQSSASAMRSLIQAIVTSEPFNTK